MITHIHTIHSAVPNHSYHITILALPQPNHSNKHSNQSKSFPFFPSFLHSAYVTVIQFYLSPSLSPLLPSSQTPSPRTPASTHRCSSALRPSPSAPASPSSQTRFAAAATLPFTPHPLSYSLARYTARSPRPDSADAANPKPRSSPTRSPAAFRAAESAACKFHKTHASRFRHLREPSATTIFLWCMPC